MATKVCSVCHVEKDLALFVHTRSLPHEPRGFCKACTNKFYKESRKAVGKLDHISLCGV